MQAVARTYVYYTGVPRYLVKNSVNNLTSGTILFIGNYFQRLTLDINMNILIPYLGIKDHLFARLLLLYYRFA